MNEDQYIWSQKYRPNNLDTYIGNEQLKNKFKSYIDEQDIPHILLTGKAGVGKTTAAKILVNCIDCDYKIINASDENSIDTVRSKIRSFASTVGFKSIKIMVLDEFDGFTRQGQDALRNIMEQFSSNTRFILTANYLEKISEPIVSRTQHFEIIPPSKKEVACHLVNILKLEKVSYELNDIKYLIDAFFPDIRKILGEAQSAATNGKIVIDKSHIVESDFKLKVVDILKSSSKKEKKFTELRQLFVDSGVRDFTDLYPLLYSQVDEFAPNNISAAILSIAEGQFRDVSVVDKEINAMAMIINLLEVL